MKIVLIRSGGATRTLHLHGAAAALLTGFACMVVVGFVVLLGHTLYVQHTNDLLLEQWRA